MQQVNMPEFSCLYTKHKTQKRKVWNDGRLVVLQAHARLHDANPVPGSSDPVLDQCELSKEQRQVLLEKKDTVLEGEKFLIEVEGLWSPPSLLTMKTKPVNPKLSSLWKKKFKRPPPFCPEKNLQETRNPILGKRKRPLQPGELVQMHRTGREAALHRGHFPAQQRISITNQNGYESNCRKMDTDSRMFPQESSLQFPCSFTIGDIRNQRDQSLGQARNSVQEKSISKPSSLEPYNILAECSGRPEHENEPTTSSHAPPTVNEVEINRNMLQRNEFDPEAFYGLEEPDEENGEESISTEKMSSVSPIIDGRNAGMSASCLPRNKLLTTGPITMKVHGHQNVAYSDDAFLEMFGAAHVDQCTPDAVQGSLVFDQPKCDRTKFVLPSQSSSEDES